MSSDRSCKAAQIDHPWHSRCENICCLSYSAKLPMLKLQTPYKFGTARHSGLFRHFSTTLRQVRLSMPFVCIGSGLAWGLQPLERGDCSPVVAMPSHKTCTKCNPRNVAIGHHLTPAKTSRMVLAIQQPDAVSRTSDFRFLSCCRIAGAGARMLTGPLAMLARSGSAHHGQQRSHGERLDAVRDAGQPGAGDGAVPEWPQPK